MGHDITAMDLNGEQVAYNRRSAGNPLNQVLYLALGVMDEAYAGCSGNGAELRITKEQLLLAKDILGHKDFVEMRRERNMSDDLLDMFKRAGSKVIDCSDPNDVDVSQEVEFVDRCIKYLDANSLDTIEIFFG